VPVAFVPDAASETVVRVTVRGDERYERIAGVDQYEREATEFADAILRQRPLRIPPSDAVATLRAIEALHRSARADGIREAVAA